MQPTTLGDIVFDGSRPLLIAGPCVIEDEQQTVELAGEIASLSAVRRFSFVFKASYSKDNRSSAKSFRGVGLERGLEILARVKREVSCPVLSDVHGPDEVAAAAEVLDVIQIPAFLSRQTSLLEAAARTGRCVNIKKGQFLSPQAAGLAVDKVRAAGGRNVMITERGTTFGYADLIVDFRGFAHMRSFGCPVIFDVTHSLQRPGGLGDRSGGEPELARMMARAAAAVPVDGFFIETHPRPARAKSDSASMLPLAELEPLLSDVSSVTECLRELRSGEAKVLKR